MESFGLWIDGHEEVADSRRTFESFDPATGSVWAHIVEGTTADVDAAVAAAERAGRPDAQWAKMSPSDRRRVLQNLARVIQENANTLAVVESIDAGKMLRETRLHVDACVEWLEYFAGYTDKLTGSTIPAGRRVLNYTLHQPYGVVGAIVPGNSPILLAMWKMAPALATGNTLVIKPSEFTSASLITLMRLTKDILPQGVVNVVPGWGPEVGTAIARHPGIRKVAFTGSTTTGANVASVAASRLAPSLLELGGKSANVVFADAVYEKAIAGIMAGVFAASGQTCMAGSRVLVQSEIYEDVLRDLVERARLIRVGHPRSEQTQVGPLGSLRQLERVEALVNRAVGQGAVVHVGGHRANVPDHPEGWYFEPTILSNVSNDWEIACEEIFGPVMIIMPFDTEEDALRIANDSNFGLVTGVWTTNLSRAHRLSEGLNVGTVFVNLFRKVLPQSPFGGNRNSGIGRENGVEVLLEYTQVKSVLIDLDDSLVQDPFLMRVGEDSP